MASRVFVIACLTLLATRNVPAAGPPSPLLDAYGDPLPAGARLRLGSLRLRYPLPIRRMSLSPDGATAATSVQGGIVLWDVKSGLTRKLISAEDPLHLAYSPNGRLLVGRWGEQGFAFLDATTGKILASYRVGQTVWGVAFSADSKRLVVGVGRKVWIVDPNTFGVMRTVALPLHPRVDPVELALAPNGKQALVISDLARDVTDLWFVDIDTARLLWKGPAGSRSLELAAFAPDGKSVAVANRDYTIQIRDTTSGKVRETLRGHEGSLSALAFSGDGKVLAWGDEWGVIRRHNLTNNTDLKELSRPREAVKGLAFSRNAKVLVTAVSIPDESWLRVWNLTSGKLQTAEIGHRGMVNCVAFSPCGRYVATCGDMDDLIRVWETKRGKAICIIRGSKGEAHSNSFSPNGEQLATIVGGMLHLWKTSSGECLAKASNSTRCYQVFHSPDGKLLVTKERKGVRNSLTIRDARTLAILQHLRPESFSLDSSKDTVAFSPDGRQMVAGLAGSLRCWDPGTWKEQTASKVEGLSIEDIGYLPDGLGLVVAGDRLVRVLDRKSLASLWDFSIPQEQGGYLPTISPDGRCVLSSTPYGVVHLHEVASGGLRRTFSTESGVPGPFAFFSDSRQAVTAGRKGTALILDLTGLLPGERPAGKLTARKCEALWQDLRGEDARRAFLAHRLLLAGQAESLPWLRKRLRLERDIDQRLLTRLIKELDSDSFEGREKAEKALGKSEELAEPALRKALASKLPPEQQRRIKRILRKMRGTPRWLQALRTVELLEHMGTADAQSLLKELARGAPQAWLTREARAALARLTLRAKAKR